MLDSMEIIVLPVALIAVLMICVEIGYRSGARHRADNDPSAPAQVGAIQGALLGLLGLLIAFSFAAAAQRFIDRQDLITMDANAIGTAFLRAELLEEPMRYDLQVALRDYRDSRLRVPKMIVEGRIVEALAESDAMHSRIWNAAIQGVRSNPEYAVVVLDPVNELIDLQTTRLSAGRKRVPKLVLGILLLCSFIGCGLIGFSCGLAGRRRWFLTGSLALLLAATINVTLELDDSRSGLLQLNDAPLIDMKMEVRPIGGRAP
ncbi:MAG: hypothetical protein KF724_07045 [Phycisphaeraceae bacterium]|nr:hypothetical protein [Phycisphaeraceae bacterium]